MDSIAIIGAGLAGLTAADALQREGRKVCVFDKSRGTGGRLATRRTDMRRFDHGAPVAQGDAAFDAAMSKIGAVRWRDGWRGAPGMSSLVKPLAEGLQITGSCRITRIDGTRGAWILKDEGDDTHGPFTDLIVAIPAPQAAELIPSADLSQVRMRPRWTLLVDWPGLDIPAVADPFESIRPQDRVDQTPGMLVAHANAVWSDAHLEQDRDTVKTLLIAALRKAVRAAGEPTYATVHRWRYALTASPLGAPFLRTADGALLGGDWALGETAGSAWASGRAMAKAVLS